MSTVKKIRVATGSCGLAAGAGEVLEYLAANAPVPVEEVGCIGHCYAEPIVEALTEDGTYHFGHVQPKPQALEQIMALDESAMLDLRELRTGKEKKKITGLIGTIRPDDIDDYIAHGGFSALRKALTMEPAAVVAEVRESKLRGRGGGGFPTGLKWSFLAKHDTEQKILICNADEGDPGAFMDRSLLESLSYQVLEGMLICAHATGATRIFIYCRAEYPLAIKRLNKAIGDLEAKGLNTLGGRTIAISVKQGAGAFVCGEETALIHSLEGRRGMPRLRPPFPTDSGYEGWPTMINNVETFANIPLIINAGAEEYSRTGTANSTGTKLFALVGDVKYPGLVEVPMGITIGEIIYDIGGAEPGSVKAVQSGGPSGGCIPADMFDAPIDYDSLNSLGAIMGSGGLIAIGANRCMVEVARYFLDFTHRESCGKCTFCRVGTKRMFETLGRIVAGAGRPDDLDFLEDMGAKVKAGSLCGLGQTAPNPVLTTLRYFRDEYEAHVKDRQCPALECSALVDVSIDKRNCIECGLCIKNCPVDCISADFVVDNRICTRCNSCIEVCPKDTIFRVTRGTGYYSLEPATLESGV
jgi:NADH-quinone oxidoreductase subunit F